jgi:hypothetical protein
MAELHSRRALLIGAPTGGLRGVERDLEQMGELLTAHQFHCETCVGPAATRDGILSAISSLAENSTGTTVVSFLPGTAGNTRWNTSTQTSPR